MDSRDESRRRRPVMGMGFGAAAVVVLWGVGAEALPGSTRPAAAGTMAAAATAGTMAAAATAATPAASLQHPGTAGSDTVWSRAVDALVGAVGDPDPAVRRSAVNSLRNLADPRGIEALRPLLEDPDPYVRRAAAVVLGLEEPSPNMRVPTGHPPALSPHELRRLRDALSDPDPAVRRAAANALGNGGGRESVSALVRAWPDPDDHVRQAVASALGSIGDPRAIPVLVEAVRDPDPHVRRVAAEALGKMRPTGHEPPPAPALGGATASDPMAATAEPLAECEREAPAEAWAPATLEEASVVLLRDRDPARREAAARAIGRLAGSAAAAAPAPAKDHHHALTAAASDPAVAVRLAAICSLGSVGDERALEALEWRTTPENDPAVRRAAEWAVGRIRARAPGAR